jgi:hypothetical protein
MVALPLVQPHKPASFLRRKLRIGIARLFALNT